MNILDHNLNNYEALLFDLDGTLINSMPWHNQAWKEAFLEFGVIIDDQFLADTMGMASLRIVEIINNRDGIKLDPKEVSQRKRAKYLKNIDRIKVVPEVFEIIKKYHNIKPMGIITGSSHAVVDMLLPKLGIDHYFKSIICSDDTKRGKDSKEPYHLAQDQLGVNLENCLFFDDGDVGLKGAKLSGMKVIHVDVNSAQIFIKV